MSEQKVTERPIGMRGQTLQFVLAGIYILGFMTVMVFMLQGKGIDKDNAELIGEWFIILPIGLLQILNYIFGSSAGSKAKDFMKDLGKK